MCTCYDTGFNKVWSCGCSCSVPTVLQHMCRRFPAAGRGVPGWEWLSCQQLWGPQSAQRATVLWVGPVSTVDLWQLGRGKKNNGVKWCLEIQNSLFLYLKWFKVLKDSHYCNSLGVRFLNGLLAGNYGADGWSWFPVMESEVVYWPCFFFPSCVEGRVMNII